jgi:TonB family protein
MIPSVREVHGLAPIAGRARRRSVISGCVSLGIHGALLVLIVLLAGVRAVIAPPAIELSWIEVVAPPPAPPPPPPATGQAAPAPSPVKASAGTLGRRGHDVPQRSQTRAPAIADPYADLAVSYEPPTGPDPGNTAGTTGLGLGAGLLGDGSGEGGGGGFGNLGLPPPPPPPPPARSLARPPRPKLDYHTWDFRASRRFAGQIVLVELAIDAGGSVGQVRVLKSVDPAIDHHAMDLARRFSFYPALDPAGHPTGGLHRWEFVIVADSGPGFYVQPRL